MYDRLLFVKGTNNNADGKVFSNLLLDIFSAQSTIFSIIKNTHTYLCIYICTGM